MKKSQYLAVALALGISALPAFAQAKKAAAAGDAAKGKDVFGACEVCHNADSTEAKVGPGLKGLFKKAKLNSNSKPANEANIVEKINEGGNGMPAYKDQLTDADRANLVAYLKTL